MSKTLVYAVALLAGLLSSPGAFAQSAGSAGTGRTSTGIGAPVGRRALEYEAAVGPSNPEQRRTMQRPEAPISAPHKKLDTTFQCDSKKCAGPSEISTLEQAEGLYLRVCLHLISKKQRLRDRCP